MTDEDIIGAILKREGGFVDNPADSGGPTNFGITMSTLAVYRNGNVTSDDVKTMKESEARDIYRKMYIEGPHFNLLFSEALRAIVVDAGVNHGPVNAAKMLQRALKVEDDGIVGITTVTAANAADGMKMARRFLAERTRFFGRMISKNLTDKDKDGIPDNTEFASGWLNRVADQMDEVA